MDDMRLTADQLELFQPMTEEKTVLNDASKRKAIADSNWLWPSRNIPYTVQNGETDCKSVLFLPHILHITYICKHIRYNIKTNKIYQLKVG